jgi:plasmid maintenance system antidote protein VapI
VRANIVIDEKMILVDTSVWIDYFRGISADTAMCLARYFGGDARSWLGLQSAYNLRVAEISNARRIAREVSPAAT